MKRAGFAQEFGWTWPALAGLLCVMLVGACVQRPSAPESRAAYFVERLIHAPHMIDDLRAVAEFPEGRGAEVYSDELSVRTALTFLRGRARLGSDLRIHASSSSSPSPERRVVTVSVNEGLAIGVTPTVQFQVELARRDNEWMVVRLATR